MAFSMTADINHLPELRREDVFFPKSDIYLPRAIFPIIEQAEIVSGPSKIRKHGFVIGVYVHDNPSIGKDLMWADDAFEHEDRLVTKAGSFEGKNIHYSPVEELEYTPVALVP